MYCDEEEEEEEEAVHLRRDGRSSRPNPIVFRSILRGVTKNDGMHVCLMVFQRHHIVIVFALLNNVTM